MATIICTFNTPFIYHTNTSYTSSPHPILPSTLTSSTPYTPTLSSIYPYSTPPIPPPYPTHTFNLLPPKNNMDFDLGKEALKTSQSYVNNKMQKVSFKHFRPYFNIDNQYLYKKILLIIFPYNTSIWESHDSSIANPDLYIPLSSLATYILLKCFFFGLQNTFQPEKIGILFTRTVFLEIFLFFITSISTYILGINTGYIESICYSGYKYFVILCIHLCGIRWIKFLFRIYMYVSFFFFLSRCLKKTVLGESSLNRTRKIYFLFGYVGIQTVLIFFLV